jgi:hypothetical protein
LPVGPGDHELVKFTKTRVDLLYGPGVDVGGDAEQGIADVEIWGV